MSNANSSAFPGQAFDSMGEPAGAPEFGLTKREHFAGLAMHAEFLSCGSFEGPAAALAEAAAEAGQSPVQRMAINAIEVADALLAELDKPPSPTPLEAAARRVIEARHYTGDDGWDKLKNAIGELEDMLK